MALALNTLSVSLSGLEGDVEDQRQHTQKLSENVKPLNQFLEIIADIDRQCQEANIEENDYTTYTYDELEYELDLVKASVSKKLAFLDNQMVARNMTNLTPIQLEEFESVFKHFDRDLSNSLTELEFSAALASLGLVYDEEEMHEQFMETSEGSNYVSFEQFIRFMVNETEDQNNAEQVFESFREVADGKVCAFDPTAECVDINREQPYVTELDLRHSLVPDEIIEDLIRQMPEHKGPDLQEDRDLPKYDYITYMNNFISGGNRGNEGANGDAS